MGNNEKYTEANVGSELMLTGDEVCALLDKIDNEGYTPTHREKAALKKVESIFLSKIPKSIDLLANLHELILGCAQIANLSGIENLTKLQSLYLNRTKITDLSGIENLTNLQLLNLSGTQISYLSGIENLASLQCLVLANTKITSLSGIENLTNLQKLDLGGTQITDLSRIENLTKLQELDLSETDIDSDELEKLSKLENLTVLDLRHLTLAKIPRQLLELNLPFDTINDYYPANLSKDNRGIFLHGSELTQQPISLFEQDRSLIEEYYNSKKMQLGEAKVVFLGDGGVGKTHTIKRIKEKGEIIKPIQGETPGISITSLKNFDDAGLDIQFWDFGGQDIMHSMHRCFLTERTCYVVVITQRQSDINKQARYWLNNIKSFAPNSPVIIFENIWDEKPYGGDLDKRQLKEEFPNIQRPIRSFSAAYAEKNEFDLLIEDIRAVAGELDSVKMEFPEKWAKIREKLLELKDKDEPFIEKDDYYQLCQDCGENSLDIAKWLLSWFNDLGVCFSYHQDRETHEELDHYKLLSPNWLFNAIYTIITKFKDKSENGIIPNDTIKDRLRKGSEYLEKSLMPEADYEGKTDYILEVMRKFMLSYKISDAHEFIPALCDNIKPEGLHLTKWNKHLTYKYKYQFLPNNVVHQMMIFWKQKQKLVLAKTWLMGFCIDIQVVDISAVIDMGKEDNNLIIDVYSQSSVPPSYLLSNIRENIKEINARLGLSPDESVSVEKDGVREDIYINPLLNMWKNGQSTFQIRDRVGIAEIELRDVIECIIVPEELRKADESVGSSGKGIIENKQTVIQQIINNYYNCTIDTNGGSLTAITTNVTINEIDEQMWKLFEAKNDHQDRIAEQLERIAAELSKQGELLPEYAKTFNVIADELKKHSSKVPKDELQKRYVDFKEEHPMLMDGLKAVWNTLSSLIIPILTSL